MTRTITHRRITVSVYAGYRGDERPRSVHLDGAWHEVAEIVHMWIEEHAGNRGRVRGFSLRLVGGAELTVLLDEIGS